MKTSDAGMRRKVLSEAHSKVPMATMIIKPVTSAEHARDKAHHEGRIKSCQRAETCNQREGHRLWNQGHGHREATENFEAVIDRLAEVKEG